MKNYFRIILITFCVILFTNKSASAQVYSSLYSSTAVSGRLIYQSNGTTTVGANSAARTSMLPPGQLGSSLVIRANTLVSGSCIRVEGAGLISARTTNVGSFTFSPYFIPSGGSKTDLSGLVVTPLIGVAGITEIWMNICQNGSGLLTTGIVKYGTANGQAYSLLINPTSIAVTSDPTVDRTIGIDGQWQNADAANYITVQLATITMAPIVQGY